MDNLWVKFCIGISQTRFYRFLLGTVMKHAY